MLVAAQMQAAVHHEMRIVRRNALALRARLAPDDGMAQHDVAGGESEHVGRAVLLPEDAVEPPALALADDSQGEREGDAAARPLAQKPRRAGTPRRGTAY